jgi:cold shock CspA family protein
VQGEVIRFDPVKGYGFIAPQGGGDDIFAHVNDMDFIDEKPFLQQGAVVEFEVAQGDRGLKASSIRIVASAPPKGTALPYLPADASRRTRHGGGGGDGEGGDDDLVEVLSPGEFRREVTEILLSITPTLTGEQILAVRHRLAALAVRYRWIAD